MYTLPTAYYWLLKSHSLKTRLNAGNTKQSDLAYVLTVVALERAFNYATN